MEKALAAKIMEAALSLGKEIGNLDSQSANSITALKRRNLFRRWVIS
jgi:hypothetical protein